MKKNNMRRTLITSAVMVVLLVFLLNPGIIPFLSDASRATLRANMDNLFAQSAAGGFSWAALACIAALICMLYLANRLLQLLLRLLIARGGRKATVAGLLSSVLNYATVILGFAWSMSLLGANVVGVVAGLGITGLIIGFGAQSLIEDIITGMFIIFEGQYNVGDIIILDDFRGTVLNIGVRTTAIMDDGGNVKIVNNSDVRNIINRSDSLSMAVCDVGIPYEVPIPQAEAVLAKNLPAMREKSNGLLTDVQYMGVQELGASAVILRITAHVAESNIFAAQRYMNRAVKMMLDENDISIPYNQLDVHTR